MQKPHHIPGEPGPALPPSPRFAPLLPLLLLCFALGACPQDGNTEPDSPVYTTEYVYHALPPEYEGEVGLTIDTTGVNLNISVSGSGAALTVEFPASLKQQAAAAVYALSVPQNVMEEIGQNINGPWTINFRPVTDGNDANDEISDADADGIVSGIINALKSAGVELIRYKDGVEEKRENKILGDVLPADFTSGISRDYTGMTLKNEDYTADASEPSPGYNVTHDLWAEAPGAVFSKSGDTLSIDIPAWNNASAAVLGAPGLPGDLLVDGNTAVTIVFTAGTSGLIRFQNILALRNALAAKGAAPANIHMSGNGVVPLFNGDDLFDTASSPGTKVFTPANENLEIYDGFKVAKDGSNKWYIEAASGKKVFIDTTLRYVDQTAAGKVKGFGLDAVTNGGVVAFIGSRQTILAGEKTGDTLADLETSAAHLDEAFRLINLNSVSDFRAHFADVNKVSIVGNNSFNSNNIENLFGTSRVLNFLESFLDNTVNASKLNTFGLFNVHVQGTNPYTNNDIVNPTELNGNLAVFLGSKGVPLQELKLTEPDLYLSPNPSASVGGIRNVVLEGDWSNITVAGASGVVTSLDTPVKSISNFNNTNLWYRVMGHNGENYTTRIYASVLEVGNNITTTDVGKLLASGTGITLKAKISPDLNRNNAILSTFNTPSNRIYYSGSANGARPSTTLESYADTVKNGGAPTISLGNAKVPVTKFA
jgi:hypothetical protein